MNDELVDLEQAVAALRLAWVARSGAVDPIAGDPIGVDSADVNGAIAVPAEQLDRTRLVAVADALSAVGRRVDAERAHVAAEIDRQSRPELGADSLAKQHGYRNAACLLAATGGISVGDAHRLVAVGKAIAPRTSLIGEALPAKHPYVAAAIDSGDLGVVAAGLIVTMLDRVAVRCDPGLRDEAEGLLSGNAPGLTLDQLRKVIAQAEAWLDPDGAEPAERDSYGERALTMFERDGMLHLAGKIPVTRGPR
ncbi:hypothetical protein GCM10022240_29090 [Microbacterium kribbense]|uniref:DUF222 domain-containing protein n=1 Tax=Microbacterium kribbense TaxID=433645 RepID=A0ABP7GW67_9MICO